MKKSLFATFSPLTLNGLAIALLFLAPGSTTSRADQKTSSTSISVQQTNDEAVVTYNKKEVWKGKVKKSIITVSQSVDGKDLAAAWDGKKIVWENIDGAAEQLKAKRKEAARRQRKLRSN